MAKDFVDCKIDQDRMTHGKALAAELRSGKRGGIPWSVFLDADGKSVVTSDGPKGNIGCPVQPAETAWFLEMLKKARIRLDDKDIEAIGKSLRDYAAELTAQRKKRATEAAARRKTKGTPKK